MPYIILLMILLSLFEILATTYSSYQWLLITFVFLLFRLDIIYYGLTIILNRSVLLIYLTYYQFSVLLLFINIPIRKKRGEHQLLLHISIYHTYVA